MMCTAFHMKTNDHYFGRNLDLDRSLGEEVCVIPRRYPLEFRRMGRQTEHYAMIGIATVMDGIPLLYDAANEHGLAMAGLNFPGNAHYAPIMEGKDNVASFELIPWILGQCRTVADARDRLLRMNVADIAFSAAVPPAPLHWMICDREQALVVEPMRDGLHIRENPAHVLTNNPPLPYQLEHLARYRHLRVDNAEVKREEGLPYDTYSQGLGAVGLPGDVSSSSRFVRMAFGLEHAVSPTDEAASVGQFFHLLSSVSMVRGLCRTDAATWEITIYSSCINTDRGLYYYTTYGNRCITCVDMHRTDLNGVSFIRYPLLTQEMIREQQPG